MSYLVLFPPVFFISTHHHSFSDFYSNLSTPTSQPASHPQTRIYISILLDSPPSTSVASPSFLSYPRNLQYLSLSTLFKSYSCPSEFKSARILLKPTALKAASWCYKGEGVLALTYINCFCSCLQQPTAATALKILLNSENVRSGTCSSKWIYEIQNCKTGKIVLSKGELSFLGGPRWPNL